MQLTLWRNSSDEGTTSLTQLLEKTEDVMKRTRFSFTENAVLLHGLARF